MKRILLLSVVSLSIALTSLAQPYFQGSFVNPVNPTPQPATLNQLVFKMKPTADITTSISYMEFAFRYPTATTPPFGVTIVSNTANFPGLVIQQLPDYVEGAYTYVKFVHNTATIASATYLAGVEKDIFTVYLTGNPAIAPLVEMASDLNAGNYVFGVVDGAGNQIDPGANPQLYGPGFTTAGNTQLLPLTNVPVPVKFLDFNVVKRSNTAAISWSIENESAVTDRYEVERSSNGVNFATIATVSPKNNGRSANSYESSDINLSNIRSATGVVYYRIKQTDRDGKFVYTVIKSVRLDGKVFTISAFPNPVKDVTTVTLDLVSNADVLILVTDAAGKQVQTIQMQGFKGLNTKAIDMSKYASGSYLLKVQAGTEIRTLGIVKTN